MQRNRAFLSGKMMGKQIKFQLTCSMLHTNKELVFITQIGIKTGAQELLKIERVCYFIKHHKRAKNCNCTKQKN